MFSRRSSIELGENAIAKCLREKLALGESVLDLTCSNPTVAGFATPDLPRALIAPESNCYQPDPLGLRSAREFLAKQRGTSADRIFLTASTSEAYGCLFKLLADPGDTMLAPSPSYPLFDHLARLDGITLMPYSLRYDGAWTVDRSTLNVGANTRGILVVNPNNPTGHTIDDDDLAHLESLGLPILSDEVFLSYAPAPAMDRSAKRRDREPKNLTFTMGGLSKELGLPHLKLAWTELSGPAQEVERAMDRLEVILDTYLSVATPVQKALPELFEVFAPVRNSIRDRIESNDTLLRALLSPTPVSVLYREGGWYATLQLPKGVWPSGHSPRSSSHAFDEAWALELISHGVNLYPGHFFDYEDPSYLVVSLLTPTEVFRAGIQILVERAHAAAH
ncbi:MAG: pyridoxal phosphate-dependent aminotransferase [Polyangiaceae bacterium]|nr:pyridoxal phosphate-dependent aminotransferase [Polyangiaceae bacterium]